MATTARSQTEDLFLTNRFSLVFESGPLQSTEVFGFQNISMPEHSIENLEYSEGIFTYSRVYPGRSTFGTITCSKGVARGDSLLGKWIRRTSEGWNYRTNLVINQYHRSDLVGSNNYAPRVPSRRIRLYAAMPVRFKPGADFDAMSSDISVQEIEIAYERFVIFNVSDGNEAEVKP